MCRFTRLRLTKRMCGAAAAASLDWAAQQNGNVQIFDTAGRQEIDAALIEEIKQLKEFLQAAGNSARGRRRDRTTGGQRCHAFP